MDIGTVEMYNHIYILFKNIVTQFIYIIHEDNFLKIVKICNEINFWSFMQFWLLNYLSNQSEPLVYSFI